MAIANEPSLLRIGNQDSPVRHRSMLEVKSPVAHLILGTPHRGTYHVFFTMGSVELRVWLASDFDFVLTTYSTLTTEWTVKGANAFVFTHHWHQVTLDEDDSNRGSRTHTKTETSYYSAPDQRQQDGHC